MLRLTNALAVAVAMIVAAPAMSQSIGSAEPTPKEIASVFKDVCLDKMQQRWSSFEADLAAWGYRPDGQGYYLNNVHATTFQLWRGEGAVFCTLFYNKRTDDPIRWTAEVMSETLDIAPGLVLDRMNYDEMEFERNIGILDPIWVEHKPMDSRGDQHVFRLYVVLPE